VKVEGVHEATVLRMPRRDPTISSGSISFIRPCAVLSSPQGLIHVGRLALSHLVEAGVVATSIVDQVDECAVMDHGVFQMVSNLFPPRVLLGYVFVCPSSGLVLEADKRDQLA
jgi:hypothetical protein